MINAFTMTIAKLGAGLQHIVAGRDVKPACRMMRAERLAVSTVPRPGWVFIKQRLARSATTLPSNPSQIHTWIRSGIAEAIDHCHNDL